MTTKYIRESVWENGGGWENKSLYWYAKGVAVMRSLPLENPKSWGFFAAIHGINIDPKKYDGLTWYTLEDFSEFQLYDIESLIKINDSKINNPQGNGFWNQCQHATWYFLPWHRGYLLGIESVLREIIADQLNGPKDWALPYWDYNNKDHWVDDTKIKIPSAFTDLEFEGRPNPLYIKQRYPNTTNQEYVDIINRRPDGTVIDTYDITEKTLESMSSPLFTSIRLTENASVNGFGGAETLFSHDNNFGTGDIEQDPHNMMHLLIGGIGTDGLMNNPDFAALDPIFYVHHANIDRLWSVWNKTPTHDNPVGDRWLLPSLKSPFIVPTSCSNEWIYTPKDVTNESSINLGCIQGYSYTEGFGDKSENLTDASVKMTQNIELSQLQEKPVSVELVGSTKSQVQVQGLTPIVIETDKGNRLLNKQLVERSLQSSLLGRIYLLVEGIKGNQEGITMLVRTVEDTTLASMALFGLTNASDPNNPHGGEGLSLTFDITDYVSGLHTNKIKNLNLTIVPVGLRSESKLTIDQISIHQVGA